MKFFNSAIDQSKYFIAHYTIETNEGFFLNKAAWELAIGQSVGNPNIRNKWETDELYEKSSCVIMHDENELKKQSKGKIKIAFPVINNNWEEDGISQLLCMVTGPLFVQLK